MHPEMVVSLALNEPPATGILVGVPGAADMLKEWGNGLAPGRAALKAGDTKTVYRFSSMASAGRALISVGPMPLRR